ncbi:MULTISPECIES: response regulator [unclassified Streptomyces]|uniref:response regulator transcription factor n=1 Tax=unclassified Streptomyces TaxID=2593676 RepID=UPI0036E34D4D
MLVADDNAEDAELLARGLERNGHDVVRVGTGSAVELAHEHADVVLLDIDLPDLDGLEVCRRIRAAGPTPVIVVTARGTELDRVLGLQAGADDYVVKPYGFRELMARLEAVMRRVRPHTVSEPSVVSHGALRIDVTTRQVTLDGRRVEVTRKEFDLLHLLASHPGVVVPRRRIMEQVWGDVWSRRTIDTHVNSLRNKLGTREWIVTVRGVGLQFQVPQASVC